MLGVAMGRSRILMVVGSISQGERLLVKWPKDGISHRKEAEELEGLENKGSFPPTLEWPSGDC